MKFAAQGLLSVVLVGHVVVLLALTTSTVRAEAVASAQAPGITVLFYNEPCALKQVTNLPLRATWRQNGKVVEGCFGAFLEAGAVGAFFNDGTVVVIPASCIGRVQAI